MRREILLAIILLVLGDAGCLDRGKRYLVFPRPSDNAPTKVQLILGLGLPMEVDVSLIIGYVMKFNYVLPYNASYLTDSYIRYDRSISSVVEADEDDDHSLDHQGGEDHVISRWEIYEMLESVLGDSQTGKACLLRAICEVSAVPFNGVHGLSSQLVHLLLTPSTTSEPFRTDFDRMYHAAEMLGRSASWNCDSLFPECEESLLEYFTEVHSRRITTIESVCCRCVDHSNSSVPIIQLVPKNLEVHSWTGLSRAGSRERIPVARGLSSVPMTGASIFLTLLLVCLSPCLQQTRASDDDGTDDAGDDFTANNVTRLIESPSRRARALVFPRAAQMLLIFGLGTPLQLDRESVIVGYFAKIVYDMPTNATDFTEPGIYYSRGQRSRWSIYRMLEKAAGLYGFGGKACLMKAICEAASTPFDDRHSLLGQLLQVLFKPSTTEERYEEYGDREYRAAERLGEQVSTENCHALYPECRRSVLDVFSTVIS
ncbi:uncharacterized protein LOC143361358 [Halictus rubicundus]|uniref:uncharacterized protein LOC143361358 n=1 Tax=Halictus rubicundus TaxID=77578 RepID=UPI0040361E2B